MYIVICNSDPVFATDEWEEAESRLGQIEEENEEFVKDEYDLDDDVDPGELAYLAGREGDHAYIVEVDPEDFDEDGVYVTSEGDELIESAVNEVYKETGYTD